MGFETGTGAGEGDFILPTITASCSCGPAFSTSGWLEFCLLLPFGLVGPLNWWTPVVAAMVAYTLFGLDALGDELEQPFSTHQNALPLDAMCRTIEIDLLSAAGETVLPQPLEPDRFVLL